MKRLVLCPLFAALLLRPVPPERPDPGASLTHRQTSRFDIDSANTRIGFEANATLGAFRGSARKVTGFVETAQRDFVDARGQIEVSAASFQTGIGLRDRHLRETIEAEKYPLIRFVLDSARYEQTDSTGAAWFGLHGRLTIRNVTRSPVIRARLTAAGDSIVVAGRLPAKFTDFEMKPPSRMLGTTKVKDDFVITFHCTFRSHQISTGQTLRPDTVPASAHDH
jgi:polyisoprenoid-binding protein YceI